MQLFEWGIASNAKGQPGLHVLGVTGSAPGAQARMLTALGDVPAGVLSHGWVTRLALGADRLTYDRLDTLVRVNRDGHGSVRWMSTRRRSPESAAATGLAASPEGQAMRMIVVDGPQLLGMRRARGLSRERLAWDAGVSITTLARLESQPRVQCRRRTLVRLAEVLGENPRALVSAVAGH
jgi:hypothetical protein